MRLFKLSWGHNILTEAVSKDFTESDNEYLLFLVVAMQCLT